MTGTEKLILENQVEIMRSLYILSEYGQTRSSLKERIKNTVSEINRIEENKFYGE